MTKRRHTLRIIADHDGRCALLGWVDVDNHSGEVKYATTCCASLILRMVASLPVRLVRA